VQSVIYSEQKSWGVCEDPFLHGTDDNYLPPERSKKKNQSRMWNWGRFNGGGEPRLLNCWAKPMPCSATAKLCLKAILKQSAADWEMRGQLKITTIATMTRCARYQFGVFGKVKPEKRGANPKERETLHLNYGSSRGRVGGDIKYDDNTTLRFPLQTSPWI